VRSRLRGDIASRIRQSLNIEQVLKTTVIEVRQLLNADQVFAVHLGNGNSGKLIY
jgi:GAF domain-containing protein